MSPQTLLLEVVQVNSVIMVPVEAVKVDLVTKADHTIFVPLADETNYGVVKVGEGLNISAGVISLNSTLIDDKINNAPYVSYLKPQQLTLGWQKQARENIGVNYANLSDKPWLSTTSNTSLSPTLEEFGEFVSLHKISKTGDYGDLLNKLELATDSEAMSGVLKTKAVTPYQLKRAIDGLGTVFELKGSVPTYSNLPTTGNEIGDIWYVASESVGYVWLKDGEIERWEKLGESIDTSVYVKFTDMDSEVIDSITANSIQLTDAQKRAVQTWMSVASVAYVDEQIGTINTALEAVLGV